MAEDMQSNFFYAECRVPIAESLNANEPEAEPNIYIKWEVGLCLRMRREAQKPMNASLAE